MSQAKVDRYKEEKKNRAKIIKKEKRQLLAMKLGAPVVAVALVAWFSVSVLPWFPVAGCVHDDEKVNYTINTSAIDEFLTDLYTTED